MLPRLWCSTAEFGSRRTASWQCGNASSALPRSSSVCPRLVWAGANAGSSSTARRKCSSASSFRPRSRSAIPRLLWATTKFGRSSRARFEMIDGLGALAQALQGRAQVAKRLGIVGPDRQRGTAAAGGTLEIAEGAVRLRQIRVVDVGVGLDRHRPADQLDRAGVIALLVMQDPQKMKRLGILLLARQHPLIQLRGRLPVDPIDAFRLRLSARLAW